MVLWFTDRFCFSPRLHAGGDDSIQTPFGSILEKEDMKDAEGRLLGHCPWEKQEPIWQSASDAVVWRNGDAIVRFLVNKPLVRAEWTLRKTVFFKSELPTLARYPPLGGFRVLNEHPHVKCHHLMPLLRDKIQQNGLLDDWKKVDTFSCVNVVDHSSQDDKGVDRSATEYLKPGLPIKDECKMTGLSKEQHMICRSGGHMDFEAMRNVALQFPTSYIPYIGSLRLPKLIKENSGLVHMLPDILEIFDTTMPMELFLVQFTRVAPKLFILDVHVFFRLTFISFMANPYGGGSKPNISIWGGYGSLGSLSQKPFWGV